MPSCLSGWIQSKIGESISLDEASQLIFALFCSVGCLPDDLRRLVWDRAALASEFADLVREGIVLKASREHEDANYWDTTITQLLIDKTKVDFEFWKRLYEHREA